jgi:hypothetical protein
VAIKDGHRGHPLHNHHNPMDAERADRISRLAGFDRMAAQPQRGLAPGGAAGWNPGMPGASAAAVATAQAQMMARERSTVGSASATTAGSAVGGGRTTATWASGGSDTYDPTDRMSVSEDMDVDAASSVGGFSDEGATSLVGFGEGARTPARQIGSVGSPSVAGSAAAPPAGKTPQQQLAAGLRQAQVHAAAAAAASPSPAVEAQRIDARLIDGMTYDKDVVDTSNRTPPPADD